MDCYHCGQEYRFLYRHWSGKETCPPPELDDREREIVEGLILGDGSLGYNSFPYLQMNHTNREFVDWCADELSRLGVSVTQVKDSEQVAEESRDSGWSPNATAQDCKAVYQFRTATNPSLGEYGDWYSEVGKTYPTDLQLSPLSAKVWYVGDGDYKCGTTSSHAPVARITCRTHADRKEWLLALFEEHGFNPYWSEKASKIVFTVEETPKFLDWLGKPIPGFGYKWGN